MPNRTGTRKKRSPSKTPQPTPAPGPRPAGPSPALAGSYDGSPLAGQMTLFDEYNGGENGGNGHRKKPNPGAPGVIVDHVKDENNDGALTECQTHLEMSAISPR